ncbi:hypothetical protein [Cellulomonas sp. URHB0016]
MNLTDDELATELQARVTALAPHATWDVPTVIAAGRRRRVLRGTGAVAGLAVVALAAALVVPGPWARDASAPPADTSTGRPLTVELRPGVVAAVGVEVPGGDVLLGEQDGTSARIEPGRVGPDGPTAPLLVLDGRGSEGESAVIPLPHALFGAVVLNGDGASDDPTTADPWEGATLLTGTVPADLEDGRVLLYYPKGFTGPDGDVTHVVEIPTFHVSESVERSPAARAPWFAVQFSGTQVRDLVFAMLQLVFASGDGSTVVPGCHEWAVGGCPAANDPRLTDEVRAALRD